MKLSTRTKYGIRALLRLAANYNKGPLQIKVIAQTEDISAKYLEQIMTILKSCGFVQSVRGAKGGYVLAKSPGQIKLSDCFVALEGSVVTTECVTDATCCDRVTDCLAREVWAKVRQAVIEVLESITVQDLLDKAKNKESLDYQI